MLSTIEVFPYKIIIQQHNILNGDMCVRKKQLFKENSLEIDNNIIKYKDRLSSIISECIFILDQFINKPPIYICDLKYLFDQKDWYKYEIPLYRSELIENNLYSIIYSPVNINNNIIIYN